MHLRRRASGLAGVELGVPLRLAAVHLRAPDRLRLAELGLRPGAVVTVLSRVAGNGRLLALGPSRIAVDFATARALVVEDAR